MSSELGFSGSQPSGPERALAQPAADQAPGQNAPYVPPGQGNGQTQGDARHYGASAGQGGPDGHGAGPAYAIPQGYAAPQGYGAPQPQQVVVPKNGGIGVLLSFFIPGLGSMINGSAGRGALILGIYAVGWILSFFLIGIPILIGAWIWGLADGYLSAQRWNHAHGIIS